ncbi:MAG: diacylglycerol/lipid kinase family protein [Verrucomicrobiota bacterium]
MKTLLIMNPGSRSGRAKKLWPHWCDDLRKAGLAFDCVETNHKGHGVELAMNASGYDAVVAVGGDGTINEVLDGVMKAQGKDLRMGVLYSGTSPDFCRFHGIPIRRSEAVKELIAGRSNRIDVARIEFSGQDGSRTTSFFGCGSNIGLGASVARISNRIRRLAGDNAGTCLAAIYTILMTTPVNLEMILDGSEYRLEAVNNLSILKSPYIASGLRLNLDLSCDDGKLVVFAVHGKRGFKVLSILPGFYSGRAAARDDVFMRECSQVSIRCAEKAELEFDGDPRGFLPVEIRIIPRALNLIGAGAGNERI